MSERMDKFMNASLVALATGVTLLLVGTGGALAWDMWSAHRAFDARAACEVERMRPLRKTFSAGVVCVPYPMRQDTLTLMSR